MISDEDVNLLILRYLQEHGFSHSSYVFEQECRLKNGLDIPKGMLMEIIEKGMHYTKLEYAHTKTLQLWCGSDEDMVEISDQVNEEALHLQEVLIDRVHVDQDISVVDSSGSSILFGSKDYCYNYDKQLVRLPIPSEVSILFKRYAALVNGKILELDFEKKTSDVILDLKCPIFAIAGSEEEMTIVSANGDLVVVDISNSFGQVLLREKHDKAILDVIKLRNAFLAVTEDGCLIKILKRIKDNAMEVDGLPDYSKSIEKLHDSAILGIKGHEDHFITFGVDQMIKLYLLKDTIQSSVCVIKNDASILLADLSSQIAIYDQVAVKIYDFSGSCLYTFNHTHISSLKWDAHQLYVSSENYLYCYTHDKVRKWGCKQNIVDIVPRLKDVVICCEKLCIKFNKKA